MGLGLLAFEKWSSILTWTLTEIDAEISVRAIINARTEQNELRELIDALTNRAVQLDKPKELPNGRQDA
jgi:hypothetical protein